MALVPAQENVFVSQKAAQVTTLSMVLVRVQVQEQEQARETVSLSHLLQQH